MYLSWEKILQCPVWKLERGRSMFTRLWGKGVDRDWLRGYGCIFLLILPLHAKWTLPRNKFSKVGVKLVAKGSTGSLVVPSTGSWSPLSRCAQAAHSRRHPLHMCSHQWKQMAVGNYSCSQPDVPAVHALHWSSVPSFLFLPFTCIKSVCSCVLEVDFIQQNRKMTACAPAVHTIWDIAFPATPTSAHSQNASRKACSQLFAEVCQGGLDQFCDFFAKSL